MAILSDGTRVSERVILISACNNPAVYQRYAAKSTGVEPRDFRRYDNTVENLPVPARYNQFISGLAETDEGWLAFVHNDFAFHDDPRPWLADVARDNLYGVVGAGLSPRPEGHGGVAAMARPDGSRLEYKARGQVLCSPQLIASGICGIPVDGMVPVQTVDCCCIIVHSSLVRRLGLRFDESFEWHFYAEELSLRAFRQWGVRTFVLPIRSGHYGLGAMNDAFYEAGRRLFRDYPETFASTCFNPLAAPAWATGPDVEGGWSRPLSAPAPLTLASSAPPIAPLALSVVVVLYKMSRQAMRTLHSLSAQYQQGITQQQYEVLIYENASDDCLPPDFVASLPGNFRYTLISPGEASPVSVLNRGLQSAGGRIIGAMIDGARIATPGLLRRALFASRTHPRSVVTAMGWYLGCDLQGCGLTHGYSPDYESRLLEGIGWPKDPYRLFEVSTQDQSSADGWIAPISESNAIFMSRDMWSLLGGFDERFVSPGGGLANLDLLKRACETPNAQHVLITDEATFHQAHGGVATNSDPAVSPLRYAEWAAEYQRIRGGVYQPPDQRSRVLYGGVRPQIAAHLASALLSPVRQQLRPDGQNVQYLGKPAEQPVRRVAIPDHAASAPGASASDDVSDQLARLARRLFSQSRFVEARDVCRLVLGRTGHGTNPQLERILGLCANVRENVSLPGASPQRRSAYLTVMARAQLMMGRALDAEAGFIEAIQLNPGNDEARFELAAIRLPGPTYYQRLSEVHEFLGPKTYLEIGVFQGDSICLARAPTLAFGVDPSPTLKKTCTTETRIYPWTSDAFFEENRKETLIPHRVDFGFIDGLHDFMQVVRDFWHMERVCGLHSVIAFHDTLPLDARSSTKSRDTGFWTGDVWKIIPFLMSERGDLRVVTIKAPPSGLTLVSGLCPSNPLTLDQAMGSAEAYDRLEYSDYSQTWRPKMCTIENTRSALADWMLFGKVQP